MYQTNPFTSFEDDFKQIMEYFQKNPQQLLDMIKGLEGQAQSSPTGTDWGKFMMGNIAKRDDFLGKGMQAYLGYDYLKSPTFGNDIEGLSKGMSDLWGGIKGIGEGIGTAVSSTGGWIKSLLGLLGI
jgi:hypothetical protein